MPIIKIKEFTAVARQLGDLTTSEEQLVAAANAFLETLSSNNVISVVRHESHAPLDGTGFVTGITIVYQE